MACIVIPSSITTDGVVFTTHSNNNTVKGATLQKRGSNNRPLWLRSDGTSTWITLEEVTDIWTNQAFGVVMDASRNLTLRLNNTSFDAGTEGDITGNPFNTLNFGADLAPGTSGAAGVYEHVILLDRAITAGEWEQVLEWSGRS